MPSLTVDGRTADLPGFDFQTRVWALEIPGSNELNLLQWRMEKISVCSGVYPN